MTSPSLTSSLNSSVGSAEKPVARNRASASAAATPVTSGTSAAGGPADTVMATADPAGIDPRSKPMTDNDGAADVCTDTAPGLRPAS